MKLRVQLLAFLGVFGGIFASRAQSVFTWSQNPTSLVFELGSNWTGGVAPTPASTGSLVFGPSIGTGISISTSINVPSITFNGQTAGGASALSYTFNSANGAVLGIGANGVGVANTTTGYFEFASGLGLNLTAAQTWNTAGLDTTMVVRSNLTGAVGLTKTGGGVLQLGGTSALTGLTIRDGTVQMLAGGAIGAPAVGVVINATESTRSAILDLGTTQQTIGSLTFGGAGAIAAGQDRVYMGSGSRLTLGGDVTFDATNGPAGVGIYGGALALGGNRRFQVADSTNAWSDLVITSAIEGTNAGLTKSGAGALELAGSNTYTGGTTVNNGILRLASSGSLPAGGNIVLNATGKSRLEVGATTQSIGSLTFGGAGGSAFGHNVVALDGGGTLTLGGNVVVDASTSPGPSVITGYGTLALGSQSRSFIIGDSANASPDLLVESRVDGTTGIGKDGTGTLVLTGANTFAGGTNVMAGTLLVKGDSTAGGTSGVLSGPVGQGMVTLQSGTVFGGLSSSTSGEGELTLANALTFSSVTFGTSASKPGATLRFSGPAALGGPAPVVTLAPRQDVLFTGPLNAEGSSTLTFTSAAAASRGAVGLVGTTGANITKVTADRAAVVIGSSAAAPNTLSLAATNGGYIGIAGLEGNAPPTAAAVLGRITDKANFSGAFGFDTQSENGPATVFSEPLDFSGFGANFTLGSLSRAILTGTITPASGGYVFGNGGGVLVVRSPLTDGAAASRSVSVTSASVGQGNSLFTLFQANNTFTGSFNVTNSGAILDAAAALPAGRAISLGAYGYLGYTEAFTGVPSFAALTQRLAPGYVATSVLGLDSHGWLDSQLTLGNSGGYSRYVTEALDLTNLGPISLGTATQAAIVGPVFAPNQGGANRTLSLVGVGEGALQVWSPLAAGTVNKVVVGLPSSGAKGSVTLGAQNTYAGGTLLQSGTLRLGTSSQVAGTTIVSGPLGTGPLTITSSGDWPRLAPDAYSWLNTTLHNAIQVAGDVLLGSEYESMPAAASTSTSSSYDQLVLAGNISDSGGVAGRLHIQGNTLLSGANTFTGGVMLESGELALGTNTALGTGPLTVDAGAGSSWFAIFTPKDAITIANNVVASPATDSYYLGIVGNSSLTLTGSLALNGPMRFMAEEPVYLNGTITGSYPLTTSGSARVTVSGTSNTYTGGTFADWGTIIFSSTSSIPPTNLLTAGYGYIGVASSTFPTSLQANFIDRFDKSATYGSIGFDSLTAGVTNTFSGAIDLSGFGPNARLGSATRAVLTGSITPQQSMYQFGGGGGVLDVNSALVDGTGAVAMPRRLFVDSPMDTPLTVRLGATNNTFSGGTLVYNSAVIFRTGTLPATGTLEADAGGYIGTEDPAMGTTPSTFINRFAATMRDGIIGFDSTSGSHLVTGPVSLDRFVTGTSEDPRIFLGTTTSATISGPITLPGLQNTYRFAGYKGGQLTVTSTLDGSRGVEIGDLNTPATFRSPNDPTAISTVTLAGANSYSAGTTLFGGALGIGSDTALGTGPLTVRSMYVPMDYEAKPMIFAAGGAHAASNAIVLNDNLEVGGTNALTLSGPISGLSDYGIYKTGTGTLTLSGSNTFTGGTHISQGNVAFGNSAAAGTGMLEFTGPLLKSATFSVSALVNGLYGESTTDLINIAAGQTLTVNQASNSSYGGQIAQLGTAGSVVYTGPSPASPSTLWLPGSSTYTGGTRIQSGIRVAAYSGSALGTGPVTLAGGELGVGGGVTLSNALTLNSGVLSGAGTFQPGGSLTIGTGVALAPGNDHGPATLSFAGTSLTLGNGGTYIWDMPDASATIWDQINVGGTVSINAATMPFTFKIQSSIPPDLMGTVSFFNPYVQQSWPVLNATAINVTGSLASAFTFDTTAVSSLIAGGTFSLSLNTANSALLLNFTPVPEPSTWILLGVGAVVLLFAPRRRLRR